MNNILGVAARQGRTLLVHYRTASRGVVIDESSANAPTAKGIVFEAKPVKLALESGKRYAWCACGQSAKQPFCDGSHKKDTGLMPIRFQVETAGEFFLCNCKQTSKRPLCDGTHKKL